MRLTKLALVLAASMALAGCESPVEISSKRTTVEVLKVTYSSKNRSHAILRETQSGYVWERQAMDNCNRSKANRIRLYSKWDVTETLYEYPSTGKRFSRLKGISAICKG